ncbi:MAG TPA: hypothetical protein VGC93_04890 [Thermoanaerobaculia bacterium]
MPTQDEVFASIISAVEAGAKSEDKELEQSARDALTERYFGWIVKPGKTKEGKPVETPQEVWDGPPGALLREKFEAIGRRAAQESAPDQKVGGERTRGAADRVQADSDCPWCR